MASAASAAAATAASSSVSGAASAVRRLVLVGGGHGHVQVIKALNRSARPRNLRVTLIDLHESASYSGMVPGCVSRLYSPDQTLIRLRPLAEWAGVDFVRGEVVDVDPDGRRVYLGDEREDESGVVNKATTMTDEGRRCVEYDAISFDIGSTTRGLLDTPGAAERAIPTRPISELVRRIDDAESDLRKRLESGDDDGGAGGGRGEGKGEVVRVVVVGGGPAGVELAMAMRARWDPVVADHPRASLEIVLLDSGEELLPSESAPCRSALRSVLDRRGVTVVPSASVVGIGPDEIRLGGGRPPVPYTHCIWATGALSLPLVDVSMRRGGLAVTDRGWIRVNPSLQSISHPSVFAAGDCAEIEGLECGSRSPPKAGVYAVRSGPILIKNLTRYLGFKDDADNGDDRLIRYRPQGDFLKLLMCGDGSALGFRFGLPLEGKWVWEMKDAIDRGFMDLFDAINLPPPGAGGTLDTEQYDAMREKWERLSPGDAADLLRRTDDGVNYSTAWKALRDMTADEEYKDDVLAAMGVTTEAGTA